MGTRRYKTQQKSNQVGPLRSVCIIEIMQIMVLALPLNDVPSTHTFLCVQEVTSRELIHYPAHQDMLVCSRDLFLACLFLSSVAALVDRKQIVTSESS